MYLHRSPHSSFSMVQRSQMTNPSPPRGPANEVVCQSKVLRSALSTFNFRVRGHTSPTRERGKSRNTPDPSLALRASVHCLPENRIVTELESNCQIRGDN